MRNLRITDLRKNFGETSVIPQLNLQIHAGEFLVLVGPSGCGKSTLLRLIAGLENVDAGQIFFGDQDVTFLSPKDRQLAMVFQNYALYPHMSVADNLAFALSCRKWKQDRIQSRVNEIAEMLEIGALLKRLPKELSGGQRQRVALGRALAPETDLILMDEPLSNLDAQLRSTMRTELKRIHRKLGSTVLYVTHDQLEATTLADRIALMEKGEIVQVGHPEEFYSAPSNAFVAQFIGTPEINLFSDSALGGDSILGLRPEHIHISAQGNLEGKLMMSEYLGSQRMLHLQWKSLMLRAMVSSDARLELDSFVKFQLDTAHLHKFSRETGRRIN